MTIIFPDVSEYNGAYNFTGVPVAIARAIIGTVKDLQWDTNKANAAAKGCNLAGYAFLNAPSLGRTVNAQADFAYAVLGTRPMMIDVEPNRGACASFADVLAFAARYRSNGGTVHLCYLPKWAWSGNMGSPSLQPLTDAGISLVSSNYTTYSDTGPGWAAYGGVTPVQWQYTDNLNGTGADGNAYKGTAAQWWAMVTGGRATGMEQTDAVVGALSRGNSIGDTYADSTNIRDEWYNPPGVHSKNPPLPGSRFDLLMQAVTKINAATSFGTTATLSDAQVASLSTAVAGAVVAHHDALTDADLASVKAASAQAIRDVLGSLG